MVGLVVLNPLVASSHSSIFYVGKSAIMKELPDLKEELPTRFASLEAHCWLQPSYCYRTWLCSGLLS